MSDGSIQRTGGRSAVTLPSVKTEVGEKAGGGSKEILKEGTVSTSPEENTVSRSEGERKPDVTSGAGKVSQGVFGSLGADALPDVD